MPQAFEIDTQVIIVGAGPAGLGCAALLKQMQLPKEDLLVLERDELGATFRRWPKEMRLITPSFPCNGFHQTDLNAITPDTSPAFSLGEEHPTGARYADYLAKVAEHYEISVQEHEAVSEVHCADDAFELLTSQGRRLRCRYLIWAGGEYQTPQLPEIDGVEHCRHNSTLTTYADQPGELRIIVGGYESGIDLAWHWIEAGKTVVVLERRAELDDTYDPSRVLSPVSQQRLASLQHNPRFTLASGQELTRVSRETDGYRVECQTGEQWLSSEPPILCTGFATDLGPVHDLFQYDDEGAPFTNHFDESTLTPRLFLAGPRLSYGTILLCFIYKFRGRFPVVCGTIAAELELDTTPMEHYLQAGMLLDDLSCCEDQECFC